MMPIWGRARLPPCDRGSLRGKVNRMPDRNMAVKLASVLAVTLALIGLATSAAHADEFAERCQALSRQVNISVVFEDRPVVSDESRTMPALNELAGKNPGDNHNVYGLTHAVPSFQMRVAPRGVADGRGQVCAVPDISLSLGFSVFVVYLARELIDGCRRSIIQAHEEEHVKTWKSHWRASAQFLTTILRREVGEARTYASREEAEAGVRAWGDELVTPWVKRMIASVREAQQVIDTPASYAAVASRLRSCPPVARGGTR